MSKFLFDPEMLYFFPLSFSPPKLHFKLPLSPVIAAKKARPSDGGSEEVCREHLILYLDVIVSSKLTCSLRRLAQVRGISTAVEVQKTRWETFKLYAQIQITQISTE